MTTLLRGNRYSSALRGLIGVSSTLDIHRGTYSAGAELALGADGARHILMVEDTLKHAKYHAGDGVVVKSKKGEILSQEGIIHENELIQTFVNGEEMITAEFYNRRTRR